MMRDKALPSKTAWILFFSAAVFVQISMARSPAAQTGKAFYCQTTAPNKTMYISGVFEADAEPRAITQEWIKHIADKYGVRTNGGCRSGNPEFMQEIRKGGLQMKQAGRPVVDVADWKSSSGRSSTASETASRSGPTPASTASSQSPVACCTPEATAKIAASAGFVDIVGIKLGMPEKDALAMLKTYNPKLSSQPNETTVDVFPNIKFVVGNRAVEIDSATGRAETIELGFTPPPNAQVVWNIWRKMMYARAERPSIANTVAALRQKYGPENAKVDPGSSRSSLVLYWVYGEQGKLMPEREAADFVKACLASATTFRLHPERELSGRPRPWIVPSTKRDCDFHVLVTADVRPSPSPGDPQDLVSSLDVIAANGFLRRSAYDATYEMVQKAGEEKQNKQIKDADQRGAPKL